MVVCVLGDMEKTAFFEGQGERKVSREELPFCFRSSTHPQTRLLLS